VWTAHKARTAVAAASLATTRQACDSERIKADSVDVLMPPSFLVSTDHGPQRFVTEHGTAQWRHKGISFYLAPVLVCRAPTKTVGLGDIISATGLLYSY